MTVRKVTNEAIADNAVTADKISPSFISDFPTASAVDLTEDLMLVYDTSEGLLKKTCFQDVPVNISNYYTCDVSECNNLYFTAQRARDSICNGGDLAYDPSTGELSVTTYKSSNFDTDFSGKSTTDLTEGTNLYYTDARVNTLIAGVTGTNLSLANKSTTDLAEGTNLYYTDARVNTLLAAVTGINLDISNQDTDDLTEGSTNLYYTDDRARTSVCQGTGVSYNNSTGEISIGQAVGTTDNVTFNNVTVSGNLGTKHIIPDVDVQYDLGSATNKFRDLYLSGNTFHFGTRTFSQDDFLNYDLTISPEILEIQVDDPTAGHGTAWLWTWLTSSLPYARIQITNLAQSSVPLYHQGSYQVNNFANTLHGSMTQTHKLYLKWILGAGVDNIVTGWVTYVNNVNHSHPDINGGAVTSVQRLLITIPSSITLPTLVAPTLTYNVAFNTTGSYYFSGIASGQNPNLGPMYRGGTYTFNLDPSVAGHPFYFTTDNGTNYGTQQYVGEWTSGVTNSRADSGTITFTVPSNAPDTLYYQCGVHSSMRGAITIKDLAVETNVNGNYVLYFQHDQEEHFTPVEIRPIPSLVNQMCLVYDQVNGKFVPQDLATYTENTPSFKNKIIEVAGTGTTSGGGTGGTTTTTTVNIYTDPSYLPFLGNTNGDLAYTESNDTLYIWNATTGAGSWNTTQPSGGTGVTYNSLTGTLSIGQSVSTTDNVEFNDVTLTGNLKGPANLIIDPAAHGDATGTVYIAGNLEVQGLTTTVNSETVTIVDKNILLASGSPSVISTDGAGITIDVANATFTYDASNDRWTANKNINANIIGTVSDISNHDTDALSEGSTNLYYTTSRFNTAFSGKSTDDLGEGSTNLYYTPTRFDTRFNSKTTDNLGEGSTNLYYTDARVNTLIAGVTGANLSLANKSTTDLAEGTNLYYTDGRFDTRLATKTTTDLAEGTNLYYTDARADARVDLETGANLDLSQKTTTDLAEGTNLYYTDARVDARIASQASGGGVSLGLAIALG
jgi:predicted RecA/RadA family phage recombinase